MLRPKRIKDYFRRGFSRNLVTLLFLFSVLPIIILSIFFYLLTAAEHEEASLELQHETARRIAVSVQASLKSIVESSVIAGRHIDPLLNDNLTLKIKLSSILDITTELDNAALVNADGREIVKVSKLRSYRKEELKQLPLTPELSDALHGKVSLSPMWLDEDSGMPHISVFAPVTKLGGKNLGALIVAVNIRDVWEIVSAEAMGPKLTAFIVDKSGDLIASRDVSRVLRRENMKRSPEVSAFLAGQTGPMAYTDMSGAPMLGASAVIPLTGWGVIVEQPKSIAQAHMRVLAWISLGVMALAAILAFALGILFTNKRILSPIRRLRSQVEVIASGDLTQRLSIDGQDELAGLAHALNDLTQELQDTTISQQYLTNILHTMSNAVFILDVGGVVIAVNDAGCAMLQRSEAEIVGRRARSFFPAEDTRAPLAGYHLEQLLTTGRLANLETTLLAGENEVQVLMSATVIHSPERNMEQIIINVQDVTVLKQINEALILSEAYYRNLFENTGAATCIFDENSVIRRCNSMFQQLSGYSSTEIQGKMRWSDFVAEEDLKRIMECHEKHEVTQRSEYEFLFLHRDNQPRQVLMQVASIPDASEHIASIQDITELKNAQSELNALNKRLGQMVGARTSDLARKARELEIANKRLMELDKLKSTFLSSVSHELRTPLTSVRGFAKLIAKDVKYALKFVDADSPKLQRKISHITSNLDIIDQEATRLTVMINDVLDLNKIESGRQDWRDQDTPICTLMHNAAVAVVGLFAQKPDVELIIDCDENMPALYADPDRVQQVLINLLSNAAKFTQKGHVRMRAEMTKSGRVRFCVSDTGKGVEQDELDQIFDKFHQAGLGDTVDRSKQGTGLGLAICKHIVERYGGDIWAESTPGQGSSFYFQLPLKTKQRPGLEVSPS